MKSEISLDTYLASHAFIGAFSIQVEQLTRLIIVSGMRRMRKRL